MKNHINNISKYTPIFFIELNLLFDNDTPMDLITRELGFLELRE